MKVILRILALWLAAQPLTWTGAFGDEPPTPLEPAAALKALEAHSDFRIEIVASEPLVEDPVAMAFDERGTLYVAEYPEFNHYRFPAQLKKTGRVKRLVDSDDDGRFEQATVFLEVPFATSVLCYNGGVLVGAPPDLLFCKDLDGDGVADKKEVVLTGFGRDFAGGGLMNSLRWGMDGQVHIATGFAGGKVRKPGQPPGAAIDVRARGLILNPRTLDFEATSGGGQHGMSMDDWGNKFLCSNVYPIQMIMYDDRDTARNPYFVPPPAARDIHAEDPLEPLKRISPLEPWRIERARLSEPAQEQSLPGGVFTSASGITVYRGDAFPEEFYGNLFIGEVANNLVYRARLEQHGIGQIASKVNRQHEFIASRDPWFRPVQFGVGPDGALYIVDMYRQLIEGAAFVPAAPLKELDPSSGIDRGRIYRVVPKSHQRRPTPQLDALMSKQLVQLLAHPNQWHRDTAARLLAQRNDHRAIAPLRLLAQQHPSARVRAVALHSLGIQQALDDETLLAALGQPDPRLRAQAVRLAGPRLKSSPALRHAVLEKTSDPDPRVRYQVAFVLGSASGIQRDRALVELVHRNAEDSWVLLAVQSSLNDGAGDFTLELTRQRQPAETRPIQTLLLDLATQVGRQNDARQLASFLRALAKIEQSDRELSRRLEKKMLTAMPPRQRQALRASGDQIFEKLLKEAEELLAGKSPDNDLRVQAVHTLALSSFEDTREILASLLSSREDLPVQIAVCQTLERYNHPGIPGLLEAKWPQLSPAVRHRAVQTLLSRPNWIRQLLDAVKRSALPAGDVDYDQIRLLHTHADAQTRSSIKALFSRERVNRTAVLEAYRPALTLLGNEVRGKKVYEKNCASCHRRGPLGKQLGPALNDAAHRDAESLLVEILDPNRSLKPQYQNYIVQTSDGRILTGMITKESANGLVLQQPDGSSQELIRIDIQSIKSSGISYMPEGLERNISPQAMADLIRFLRSNGRYPD